MRFQKRTITEIILAALFTVGVVFPATIPPAAPTNLTAVSSSSSSIALAWSDNSADETGFMVQRSPTGTSKWARVTTTAPGVNTFVNAGLTTGKTYFFRVCAVNGRSKSAFTNVASAAPTAQNPVNQPPVANAGADRTTPTLSTITLNGSGSTDPDGTIASYAWTFGDGGSATGLSVSHAYATSGTFTVTLTVTDNGGLTASDSSIVTVTNRAPIANAGSDQSATVGVTVSFNGGGSSDADGSIVSFSWNFGDGSTGSGVTTSHTYQTTGAYNVTLAATDDSGATGSDTAVVSVNSPTNRAPVANAGADQTALTLTTLSFNGSGSSDTDGNITSYSWNFGDGSTGTGMTASHAYSQAGSYTVTLTVTDNIGATASDTALVTATNRAPAANAGADQTAATLTSFSFNGSGSSDADGSIATYSWNFGDGSTGAGMTASHSFSQAGTFTVTLTVTDNLGATASDTTLVTATNRAPSADAGADKTAETLTSVGFNGSASSDPDGSISSYSWNFGDGSTGSGMAASHSYSQAGTFTVTLTVTDNLGATGSDTASAVISVTVPSTPTNVSASTASSSQINLSWTGSASSFKVEHAASSTGPWSQIGTTASTTFQDTSLSSCSTWFYHVSACNASGGCSAFSSSSSATTQMTVPSAPTGVSASPVTSTQINLSWTSSSSCSASSFKIERATASTGPWSQIGTATAMSYQDSGLASSTAYYYHVRATNSVGDSAFSSSATATTLQASTQLVPWSEGFGSTSDDRGHAIAIDGADNTYATGHFTGTVNLGSVSLTSALISVAAGPSQDCFLAKYTPSGQVSWAKKLGADGNDAGNGVAVDNSGSVTVVGQAGGWMLNFGGQTHYTFGGLDAFVAKYSDTGTYMWSKLFGSGYDDAAMAVATDATGNVIVTGFFSGTIYPGVSGSQPTLVSTGGSKDVFIVKYSSTGTLIWAKRVGGAGIDTGYAVSVDAAGDVIVTGAFQASADFGGPSSLVSAGGYDIFVAKYSGVDGSYMWSDRYGSSSDDVAFAVTVDRSDNVIVGGSFQGTVNFGGTPLTSAGGTDAFVASYSRSGSWLWSKRGGGPSNDRAYGVTADGMNNVFATGYFQGVADFGGRTFSALGMDMFAVEYSVSGGDLWSANYGGGSTQIGNAIAAKSDGKMAVTGSFDYTIDLGTGMKLAAGGMDTFVGTNIVAAQ